MQYCTTRTFSTTEIPTKIGNISNNTIIWFEAKKGIIYRYCWRTQLPNKIVVSEIVKKKQKNNNDGVIGIDLGFNPAIALSTGEKFYTPKILIRLLQKQNYLYQSLKRKIPNSKKYQRIKKRLFITRRKINQHTKKFLAAIVAKLENYGIIYIERPLNVDSCSWLARKILMSIKSKFKNHVVIVNKLTSEQCSHCGSRMVITNRRFVGCPQCAKIIDRDINAARCVVLAKSAQSGHADRPRPRATGTG